MIIGEVCLLTNDVRKLADFYKRLLEIDNNSDDDTHQFIITEETTLTVYNLINIRCVTINLSDGV